MSSERQDSGGSLDGRRKDSPRHDSDLAFAGLDDARAVGANEPSLGSCHVVLGANHVLLRDTLRNTHHKVHLGVDGLSGEAPM